MADPPFRRSPFSALPERPPPRSWDGVLDVVLLVGVVLAPLLALHRQGRPNREIVGAAAVGLVAGVAIVAIRRSVSWRWVGLALASVTAAAVILVVGRLAGRTTGAWMGIGLLVVGGLMGVGSLHRWVGAAARGLGHAIVVILFIPLGVLAVVMPWLVNSVARLDPLRSPVTASSTWMRREAPDVRPDQPWSTDPVPRLGGWYRVRSVAAWPVLLVAVVVAVVAAPWDHQVSSPTSERAVGAVPAAHRGDAWYDAYREDLAYISSPLGAGRPIEPNPVADVRSRTVNVEDGVRRSWRPPACDCRRLKVWLYGGSAAFGLGQRDDRTIASSLARTAWDHGIALDVENRGALGDSQWEEAERYLWDTATYGPPDLVIFYDGADDVTATQSLVDRHVGDVYAAVDISIDDFWRDYLATTNPPEPDGPPGGAVVEPPTVHTKTPEAFASLLWKRYRRGRWISDSLSALRSVPTYYCWQPTRLLRPQAPGEPRDADGGYRRRREGAVAATAPSDVIDLTHVLDDLHAPVFTDDQHHNEVAARAVGEAMFEELAPGLRSILQGRPAHVPAPG